MLSLNGLASQLRYHRKEYTFILRSHEVLKRYHLVNGVEMGRSKSSEGNTKKLKHKRKRKKEKGKKESVGSKKKEKLQSLES